MSTDSRLLRWIACSGSRLRRHDRFIEATKPWPENSTFAQWWQTMVLLCVEEMARASTSSHLSFHFDGFMVHSDVPVTFAQQFTDDAPADYHRIHHPFRLEGALLLHTLLVHWVPVPHRSPQACGWRPPALKGWCTGRWTAPLCGTGSQSCAGRSVLTSRKMWAPMSRLLLQKVKPRFPKERQHTAVGVLRAEGDSITVPVDGRYPLHNSELENRQGCHGFVAPGLSPRSWAMLRFGTSSCFE